jgi:type IV secretory pathway TraG/TraD family ATPase VirD4
LCAPLEAPGLLLFDPKLELANICGSFLARRGAAYVLNRFGLWRDRLKKYGLKEARVNPMVSWLNPELPSYHADCDKLALAFDDGGSVSDPHWRDSALMAISGVIAALAKFGAPEDRNLPTVRAVITGASGRSFYDFCRECMSLPDPYLKQKLARFAVDKAEENKELNGIISAADTLTAWLGNEAIAESLKGFGLRFS